MCKRLRTGLAAVACLLMTSAVPAQSASPEPAVSDSPWVLGLAVGHGKRLNPFTESDDMDIHAVLDIAWHGERFFFDNGDFGAVLGENRRFSLSAIATFDNERNYFSHLSNGGAGIDLLGYLSDDGGFTPLAIPDADGEWPTEAAGDPDIRGGEHEDLVLRRVDSSLPDRDFALNTGVEFLRISRWGDWQGQVLTDVSGTHGGEAVSLSYTYPWFLPESEFAFTLGLEWKSRDLVDYYYGVRPDERLPGRPAYRADSGANTFIRFSAQHSLGRRWKLVSVLEREHLSSAIRRSPVIDRRTRDTFFVGLYYRIF